MLHFLVFLGLLWLGFCAFCVLLGLVLRLFGWLLIVVASGVAAIGTAVGFIITKLRQLRQKP